MRAAGFDQGKEGKWFGGISRFVALRYVWVKRFADQQSRGDGPRSRQCGEIHDERDEFAVFVFDPVARIKPIAFCRDAEDDCIPASTWQIHDDRNASRLRCQKRREFFLFGDAKIVRAAIIEYRCDAGLEGESSTFLKWKGPSCPLNGRRRAFSETHNGSRDMLRVIRVNNAYLVFSRRHDARQRLLMEIVNRVDDGDMTIAL